MRPADRLIIGPDMLILLKLVRLQNRMAGMSGPWIEDKRSAERNLEEIPRRTNACDLHSVGEAPDCFNRIRQNFECTQQNECIIRGSGTKSHKTSATETVSTLGPPNPGCAATNAHFHAFPRSNAILNRKVVSSVGALAEFGVRPVLVADEDIPHLQLTVSC